MTTPEYIDIHSHLNFAAFDADREEVIKRTQAGKTWVINVGTQAETSRSAIDLAQKVGEGMFATVGLHPVHTGKSFYDKSELGEWGADFASHGEIYDEGLYHRLAQDPLVVAIGECGLDYFRLETDTKEKQKEIFIKQIELANEVKKPLMLHVRNAYQDAYDILKTHAKVPANMHFFAGNLEEAKMFLDLGFTLSFTGVITFARNYDEVIRFAPLDRIMAETDAPYVAPAPFRATRNEPLHVKYVIEKLAELKVMEANNVALQVLQNAQRLFKIAL